MLGSVVAPDRGCYDASAELRPHLRTNVVGFSKAAAKVSGSRGRSRQGFDSPT
jgi:hypothetical protein